MVLVTSSFASTSNKTTYWNQKIGEKGFQLLDFKGWFEEVKDDCYKVTCLACKKILATRMSKIQKHINSSSDKIKELIESANQDVFKLNILGNHILVELKYAFLIVDDNLPFNVIENINCFKNGWLVGWLIG